MCFEIVEDVGLFFADATFAKLQGVVNSWSGTRPGMRAPSTVFLLAKLQQCFVITYPSTGVRLRSYSQRLCIARGFVVPLITAGRPMQKRNGWRVLLHSSQLSRRGLRFLACLSFELKHVWGPGHFSREYLDVTLSAGAGFDAFARACC